VGIEELIVDLGLAEADRAPADRGRGLALDAREALAILGPVERSVASVLVSGPASIDAIVRSTRHPPSVVAGALTLLQLRGWAESLGPLQLPAGPLLRTRSRATRDPT
jgi:hypothetical protein